ncbi:unnamed protein product [Nesidiocoris tenuis]|uniref:Sema domain-containing protein n=1 Tax=Nesidiocoris tenuis TaxID=355587 RepID=A0A6H5GZ63_9HEMI|nr:unnamed protein product [Nesidiocoris tenuis]
MSSTHTILGKTIFEGELENQIERFSGNESFTDFFKLLEMDSDSILIGSRNVVFNISLVDLSENVKQRIVWPPTAAHRELCYLKGKSEEDCHNYIRVGAKLDEDRLLLCGTNAYKPLCRHYKFDIIYSRVARVCKRDKGGPHQFWDRWTSLIKARLNCSVPGDYPFYFDEIQSTSDIVDSVYNSTPSKLIYGIFTTPTNAIGGSAICAFSMDDIMKTFDGAFKEQESMNSNWLRVPPNKVPHPRPGQCVNDSRTLPDKAVNFVKTHTLMDEAVPSINQPLLVRISPRECVGIQDPYCAWDTVTNACIAHGDIIGSKQHLIQNVFRGVHTTCQPSGENSVGQEKIVIYSADTLGMVVTTSVVATLVIGFVAGYFCSRHFRKNAYTNMPLHNPHNSALNGEGGASYLSPCANNKSINLLVNVPPKNTIDKNANTSSDNNKTLQKVKKTYI